MIFQTQQQSYNCKSSLVLVTELSEKSESEVDVANNLNKACHSWKRQVFVLLIWLEMEAFNLFKIQNIYVFFKK